VTASRKARQIVMRRLVWTAFATALLACSSAEERATPDPPQSPTPSPTRSEGFAGSASCVDCHEEATRAWTGSHHDLAMQVASEATVLGDFENASFSHFGVTSRFFKRDGRFFVHTEGGDGELADFEIAYTFGVENLQQYLIAFPGGRLQALGIAWDTRAPEQGGGRWFHLYPNERIAPEDPLHWTGRYQSWNAMCAECHSTNLQKRYDADSDTYVTTWDEIDVSCETCHGPGLAHVAWAEEAKRLGVPATGHHRLVVEFKTDGPRTEVDVCAPCHSRRHPVSGEDEAGRPFLDDFMPATLRAGLYHADGQVLEEVYVYGSFLQSRMYHRGVRCSDCQTSHSLKLLAEGNVTCVRCHQEQPDPRFPTLARKKYDSPEHHFHREGKPGTQCVDCHMPATTYMVVDPRRDHSLRVPRPDLSLKLGTPDACSGCHTDQTIQWSADWVVKWYGPQRRRDPHYGELIAAGRRGDPRAAERLVALVADTEEPVIVRATALELLPQYGLIGLPVLTAATRGDEPLLRATAAAGLARLPLEQRQAALPLLEDPIRAVRIEAARVLAGWPADRFEPGQHRAFDAALREYREAQLATADLPGGRFNLAVLEANLGEPERAEQSYRVALRMDPDFLPARTNLVNLYNALGRNQEAERELLRGIERAPQEGELHYSLGLLLAEEQRLEEAVEALGRASTLLPDRARVHYNQGLALQQLGRRSEAGAALRRAREIDPRDSAVAYALAVFYAQQGQWERALPHAQALLALSPGSPESQQLLRRIQSELAAGSGKP
jgi:tetratricopeptide (TPR) repeat protein